MVRKNVEERLFDVPDYEGCGIYAILNLRQMKCYIGASHNIKLRATQHKISLKNGKHANKLLQEDFNKGEKFDFLIICKLDADIPKNDLIAIEKIYMITAMDERFSIYNLIPKTNSRKQKEWIYVHLIAYLTGKYNTRENFVGAFLNVFKTTPAHMNHRKPDNRKRD